MRFIFPICFATLLLFMSSCHYLPFLKYRNTKGENNFPKFKEKNYFTGSPNALRRAYDITCYDWTVDVQPDKKRLDGTMVVHFKAGLASDSILLDLQGALKVKDISSSHKLKSWKHKGDLLYVVFENKLIPGELYKVDIAYGGKPASILSLGPVFWSEDSLGKPRVSTLTQGIGPHFVMPCKDLLYDEPDSCFIRVIAPADLMAVANGKLTAKMPLDNKIIWHYAVMNPINVYNISFNVGDFLVHQYPYTDIEGTTQVIEAAVLFEKQTKGYTFYKQTPAVMAVLEELYGPFPWWNDGCRFVQSSITGGAMEHQSAISMGDIMYYDYQSDTLPPYNSTIIHELAHEWWGNSITATDYGDAWLHEGMATFTEAVVMERLYGKWTYDRAVQRGYSYVGNERPVIKPFGVRYNSWANGRDGNIYSKGAIFMHTLRMQINNDELFFTMLRNASQHFAKSNITTADLEAYFSAESERDLSPFFEVFLRQKDAPTLQFYYNDEISTLFYKWKEGLPENFRMVVHLTVGENEIELVPSNTWQEYRNMYEGERTMDRSRSGYFLIEKLESQPVEASKI